MAIRSLEIVIKFLVNKQIFPFVYAKIAVKSST